MPSIVKSKDPAYYYVPKPTMIRDGELSLIPTVLVNTFKAGGGRGDPVERKWLRDVMRGLSADSGRRLSNGREKGRVPGYDFCFRADRSVSLLLALGGKVADDVVSAHRAAVDATLPLIVEFVCFTRRRRQGKSGHVHGEPVAAISALHLNARATYLDQEGNLLRDKMLLRDVKALRRLRGQGLLTISIPDPDIHTHLLLINAIYVFSAGYRGWKKSVQAIDGKRFLRPDSKLRRFLQDAYETELVLQLQKRGYAIYTGPDGRYRVAGISDEVRDRFLKRSKQIAAMALNELPRGHRQRILLETRVPKSALPMVNFPSDWAKQLGRVDLSQIKPILNAYVMSDCAVEARVTSALRIAFRDKPKIDFFSALSAIAHALRGTGHGIESLNSWARKLLDEHALRQHAYGQALPLASINTNSLPRDLRGLYLGAAQAMSASFSNNRTAASQTAIQTGSRAKGAPKHAGAPPVDPSHATTLARAIVVLTKHKKRGATRNMSSRRAP